MLRFVFEDTANHLNLIESNILRDAKENNFRYNQSPISNDINDLWNVNRELHQKIKPQVFNLNKRPRKYIIPIGLNESPNEWANGYNPDTEEITKDFIFSVLSDEYIKDLRNGRAFLLLDSSLEGYHEDWAFKYIHIQCNNYNISPDRVILVTGNVLLEQQYVKWSKKNKPSTEPSICCIGYPHFLYEVQKNAWNRKYVDYADLITYEDHIKYKEDSSNNIKLFSCTNKRPRPHRVWLYKDLVNANLVDKAVLSMSKFDPEIEYKEGAVRLKKTELRTLVDDLPLEPYGVSLDSKPTTFFINRFNEKHSLDSWVNVVSEARYYDGENTIFLSEKIFKAIALEQPFIIVGNKGSLKALQELGFKTFNDFFDESYDERNYKERIPAVIRSLQSIDKIDDKLSWYKSMKDVLKYNTEHLTKFVKRPRNVYFDKLIKHYYNA